MAFFSFGSASGSSSSSSSESNLATAKTILSAAASVAATAMVVRSVVNDFLPSDVMEEYLYAGFRKMFRQFSSELTMVIEEFDGLTNNQVYEAAQTYLGKKISPSNRRLKVSKPDSEKDFMVTMARDEEILDVFEGIKLHWVMICREVESKSFHNRKNNNSTLLSEVRSLELSFHNKHKDMVLKRYLEAKSIKQEAKALRIFTMDYVAMYRNPKNAWAGTNLDHPATFDTLALDSKMKEFVLEDLKRFLKRKDYYKKIGKAWKRGYLLYGPPGTGKSSLIAAMANFLHFDIYDLELTEIECNSDLRRLLIGMPNRSILVVEDIDCTIELENRSGESKPSSSSTDDSQETKVTLSGLLNFIDGLWSSCGDERIIVFTTNHKEKLDPALLRPGRMDVHIHMSYCTPCGFRQLARNYLGPQTQHHTLFPEIEHAILATQVTPAEVAEELLKGNDNDAILKGLLDFLKRKKIDNDELEAKKRNEAAAAAAAAAHSQVKEKQQEAHTEDNDENK